MTELSSSQIRETFISYFESLDHTRVKAAPVVPANDPTLLFTNAGMNQFKDVFLGQGTREYTRAVDSQPCIRVSGKHNDLEDVGKDTTHLTLFEMLGNWSFGDYYKKEAIGWAWKLLTEVYQIPKDKLYATVYKDDDESMDLWKTETDIAHDRILKFGDKDNFWEMGAVGPCGPCSEIHIDLGPEHRVEGKTPGVNGDDGQFIEIWNLVFIQSERLEDGSLKPLENVHVDTGAGLERIVAFLQGKSSVYQTDLFIPILDKITELSGKSYDDGPAGMPHRVIADHIRTLCFSIADNVMPSNEGRGYVLRRLLRRALRYSTKYGFSEPVLHQLVDSVVDAVGGHYEQLAIRKDFIKQIILSEEKSFLRTLESGEKIFQELAEGVKAQGDTQVSGEQVFKLYDTYGFPVDLTAVMAEEAGLSIDQEGFEKELNAQRAQSRKAVTVHQANFDDVPKGGEARLVKTPEERLGMAQHHTSTHLLHEALRRVLGDHVFQAGSLVDIDHLRFDFSHFQGLTPGETEMIETMVNEKVKENIAVEAKTMALDEAKELGAMALFGEKYDDEVRVIGIGDFSLELCGGHHVSETGEIEAIKIIDEGAISAGTRRMEAIAGIQNIQRYCDRVHDLIGNQIRAKCKKINKMEKEIRLQISDEVSAEVIDEVHAIFHGEKDLKLLKKAKKCFSSTSIEVELQSKILEGIDALKKFDREITAKLKETSKELAKAKQQTASSAFSSQELDLKPIEGTTYSYAVVVLDDHDLGMARQFSDNFVVKHPEAVLIALAQKDDLGFQLVRSPKALAEKEPVAKLLFAAISEVTGAKGGGRPDMAQGGGADPNTFDRVPDKVAETFASLSL